MKRPDYRAFTNLLVKKTVHLKDRIWGAFARATIATRMTMAYLPLAIVIVLISIYTLFSLKELGNISQSIVENNMVIIEAADDMQNSLLAQESFGRRFLIMQSQEMAALFEQRNKEFQAALRRLRSVEELDPDVLAQIAIHHQNFKEQYEKIFALSKEERQDVGQIYEVPLNNALEKQLGLIRQIVSEAKKSLNQKTVLTGSFSTKAFHVTAFLSILGIGLGVGAAYLITRNVSRSLKQLKLATTKFSERQFDFVPDVKRHDEFGRLAQSFTAMAQRLARLEVMDLDASPLTRLPGGLAIENVLKERLTRQDPVAFCLLDIDNFKSFNDRYGYSRGNEVIKATGKIVENAIARHGKEDAFLGHIGGDDFAFIVQPNNYVAICEAVIGEFDKNVDTFYEAADLARGFILAQNRQGETEQFPLMTVSIAVVTNENRPDLNGIKIGEIAAEVKEHAKSMAGSVYLIDRRTDPVLVSP